MKRHTLCIAMICILSLLFSALALADWSEPDANLVHYEEMYGEESEDYKAIKQNTQSAQVAAIKEALIRLGYFTGKATENYYRSTEIAIRAFATQMRIGGDGSEITPLMQAMLADVRNMPKAVSPAIDNFRYGWEANNNSYTPYTYARITRGSVLDGKALVGFTGRIDTVHGSSGSFIYAIQMENDPAKLVYVLHEPLPRTTIFQVGDEVAVFGVTQGEQPLPYVGMEEPAPVIDADRVGYAPLS